MEAKENMVVIFSEADILKVDKAFKNKNGYLPGKIDFEKAFEAIILDKYPNHEIIRFYEQDNPYSINFEIKEPAV